ncbi:30S ribosomal protein S9 [bacterium]|nr:30S ribosomal protein S9 [bacterium]MBU1614830.1 30S ribosomal protein S9 [bacterium]
MAETVYYGRGTRKEASAKVWLTEGTGKFVINKMEMADYFKRPTLELIAKQPLVRTNTLDRFDITVEVKGGGVAGQVGAIRHGISRALVEANEEFRPPLRKAGLLTRDPRSHERKKYGLAGRRKKYQFSKR